MLSYSKNLGLEAKNHQSLVSDFWIRDLKVIALPHSKVKSLKICRLKVIIYTHLSRPPSLFIFEHSMQREDTC